MSTGKKKRILKSADVRACDTFTGEIDERFVCRLACEQALLGGAGMREGKGEYLIGHILTPEEP